MFDRVQGSVVNVVLADHDRDWMMQVAAELSQHPQVRVVGFAQTGKACIERAASLAADAVLTEYALTDMTAADVATALAEASPGTAVFAVSSAITGQLVMTARSRGIVEVFAKDGFVGREVAEKIARHVDELRREWTDAAQKYGTVDRGVGPQGRVQGVRTIKEVVTRSVTQSIILCHSPKGGVGKTTIAVNLAVAIKNSPVYSGVRVALLDFDADFGNTSAVCNLPPNQALSRNLYVWEHVPNNMSPNEVDDLMIPMEPSGVMVLPSPFNPAYGRKVTGELAEKILSTLKKYYGVIVIDGGPKIPDCVDVAMDHATHILCIAEPEKQSVENLARTVHFLSLDPDNPSKPDLTYILRKMLLVVNKVGMSKNDLSSAEVARGVGLPVVAEIPFDDAVKAALHSSRNLQAVELAPDAPFSRAIRSLANDICSAYPTVEEKPGRPLREEPRRGFFGRLFARRA